MKATKINMKKLLTSFCSFAFILVFIGCTGLSGNIVGKWHTELYGSDQIIEFTADGAFIDHTTSTENRYRISRGNIITYVEDDPDSKVSIPYSVKGETLTFGGAEYEKYTHDTKKDLVSDSATSENAEKTDNKPNTDTEDAK